MGPNPALGTNTGQTYIGQEGTGTAAILGPSRAADTYVTMRREQLATERTQQAAAQKAALDARKTATEKLMKKPDYYVKYDEEIISRVDVARGKGAELIAEGLDPFAPSKDQRVIDFQKQWDELESAAKTSLIVQKYDEEIQKTTSTKGAADDFDIESFVGERDAFFNRPLNDIAKNIDDFPVLKDRYGVVKAATQLKTYVTTLTGLFPVKVHDGVWGVSSAPIMSSVRLNLDSVLKTFVGASGR